MNENETLKEKKWLLRSPDGGIPEEKVRAIAAALGIEPIVARLLCIRGYDTPESAYEFIRMESEMLGDPFSMRDMESAVRRIATAVSRGERITIYGDYDVDGVTSVCVAYLYLRSKGADIDYYIPNRIGEGYGVSKSAVEQLAGRGTKLIITVDTGITATEEVLYAKSLGVDFVVTDHHECRSELPEAEAVVNPHRPDCGYQFKDLAGVGVIFKLIAAYEEMICGFDRRTAAGRVFGEYADLVAIGTIADVMPIKGENRIIVSYGLKLIEQNRRCGLTALIDASSARPDGAKGAQHRRNIKITSGYIGYTLAPRINAAGRIRTATMAVELFLSETYEKAYPIAEELCRANKERQSEENKIIEEARRKIDDMDVSEYPVIVLDADTWHHGVIGIVSSRITERYSRPSILVSFEGNPPGSHSPDDVGKGSGRSVRGMNMVDALCYCDDLLVKFGGHELAAGLSVTRGNLPLFRERINEYARIHLTKEDLIPQLEADCEINFSDINLGLADGLRILEPYGVGNPLPTFIIRDVRVIEIQPVSEGKHSKITLGDGNSVLTAMYFSNSPASLGICVGDSVDCMFNVDVNEWCGRRTAQLTLKDIRPSETQCARRADERERYNEIWNGATYREDENILPERADFETVYRYIFQNIRSGTDRMTNQDMIFHLSAAHSNIGYIKLRIIIKVFSELNIIGIEECGNDSYRFYLPYPRCKTDLEKSTLLRRIRSQKCRK